MSERKRGCATGRNNASSPAVPGNSALPAPLPGDSIARTGEACGHAGYEPLPDLAPTTQHEPLSAEYAAEAALYEEILAKARDSGSSPDELLRLTAALAFPGACAPPARPANGAKNPPALDDLQKKDEADCMRLDLARVDRDGNPGWISLTLPQRDDDFMNGEAERGPGSAWFQETDAPTSYGRTGQGRKYPGMRSNGGQVLQPEGVLSGLLRRLSGKGEQEHSYAQSSFQSRRPPRPLRNFIRMLLVTAILGMLYHILSLKGWLPRLF
mgnify:CR=1 FL=1